MSLTFYFAPMSTASMVHWTLEELGVPYEAVRVDLADESDKRAKLGPVNPNLKVPALIHDGVALFESAAINIYLGETFGVEKGLYPTGARRGRAMSWITWTNVSLGEAMSRFQRNASSRVPQELRNAKAGEQAQEDLAGLLSILDNHLARHELILGEEVSVADFHVSSYVHYMSFSGVDVARFAKVDAWVKRCTGRPAYVKLMSQQA